jgi:hypothetical protein
MANISSSHKKLMDEFREAFALSRPISSPDNTYSFSVLYKKSQNLIEDAWGLVKKFEAMDHITSNLETSGMLETAWDEEDASMAKLLDTGRAVGVHKYYTFMGKAQDTSIDEETSISVEKFYGNNHQITQPNWDQIARKQEKYEKRIIKACAEVAEVYVE